MDYLNELSDLLSDQIEHGVILLCKISHKLIMCSNHKKIDSLSIPS